MTTHNGRRFVVGKCLRSLLVVAIFIPVAATARAEVGEFVVENEVFDGKQSIGGSTTIFVGGKAYDFLKGADEAVVFDPAAGRITLVDFERRVRSELTLEQITDFITQMRERAMRSGSDFARFTAQPEFGQRLDAETNELVLSSALLEYRASTTAPATPKRCATINRSCIGRPSSIASSMREPCRRKPGSSSTMHWPHANSCRNV
ncbi:MAG: hypothetical protein QM775_21210 [Pirellulales bacterium]